MICASSCIFVDGGLQNSQDLLSHPERRQIIVDRKGKVKGLGDIPYQPTSQTMGLLSGIGLDEDIEIFAKLAEGYVFEGVDRPSICAHNAEVGNIGSYALCREMD